MGGMDDCFLPLLALRWSYRFLILFFSPCVRFYVVSVSLSVFLQMVNDTVEGLRADYEKIRALEDDGLFELL